MKKNILLLSCLLLYIVNINGQVSDKINFQMLVRNAADELLSNSPIGLKFQVLQSTNTGNVVFEETHNTTSNPLGVVSVKIGGGLVTLGALNTIDWSDDTYYIKIGIDPLGGSNFTLQSTSKVNSVPLAASTLKSASALSADYNSLTNKPFTITTDQLSILGAITLYGVIDLDATKTAVDLNTLKSFPGFGNTKGTAFEIFWSKIGNNVFFENGNIGVGTNTNLNSSAALLNVNGGVLYETSTNLNPEIGTLKYLNLGNNSWNDFYYGDNLGTFTIFKSELDTDIVFLQDVNILSKLGIGNGINSSYNFGNNNFVIASSTPNIRFQDTSVSASFPTADWRIEINENTDLGESYFSISNINTGNSNFKIMAGAPSNAFTILENGNVGLNIETPTTKLEVSNTIVAQKFTGDASGLTNIPLSSTANTSNTGSTTIGADNNADSVGAILFQTQNQNQMSITSNGNVAIGNINPTATLEVDGNLIIDDIKAQNIFLKGRIEKQITFENISYSSSIDVGGKSIIIMNPTFPVHPIFPNSISGISNVKEGQVITFINSGTQKIQFSPYNLLNNINTGITLESKDAITIVRSGGDYLILNLVN